MTESVAPRRCPIGHAHAEAWLLTRHADVVAAAQDDHTFSSAVSRHLQIPNGLDGPEHDRFRPLVDSFFTPERMADLEPTLRKVAADVVAAVPRGERVEPVADLGTPYAVQATCAWLGWPASLEPTLLTWMRDNHEATRSADHNRTSAVAARFDEIIGSLTDARREAGDDAPHDVTTELVRSAVDGEPLVDEEIVSILRNWTAGDISSIALCLGVVIRYLADHDDVQRHLRGLAGGRAALDRVALDRAALDRAIDEILRIDDPFVSNRRVATHDVDFAGVGIAEGERLILHWTSANRDPQRFGDPDEFRPEVNASHNLVYGTGRHVCPGRPLASLELRVLVEELLATTSWIDPVGEIEREQPPLGGYRSAPVVLRPID